jgi:hypothetical protein
VTTTIRALRLVIGDWHKSFFVSESADCNSQRLLQKALRSSKQWTNVPSPVCVHKLWAQQGSAWEPPADEGAAVKAMMVTDPGSQQERAGICEAFEHAQERSDQHSTYRAKN